MLAEQRLADLYAAADRERLVRGSRAADGSGRGGRPEGHARGARYPLILLRRLARLIRPVRPAVAA
jgi:hypothetical protein